MNRGKIQNISKTCFSLHSSTEFPLTIAIKKKSSQVLEVSKLMRLFPCISWILYSIRSCWYHLFKQLVFYLTSSFLTDKEAISKLLCQGTPCSLSAVSGKSSPHLPNSLSSDLSISSCTKQNMPLVQCANLFFTDSEVQLMIYANIFLEDAWFCFVFLIRLH